VLIAVYDHRQAQRMQLLRQELVEVTRAATLPVIEGVPSHWASMMRAHGVNLGRQLTGVPGTHNYQIVSAVQYSLRVCSHCGGQVTRKRYIKLQQRRANTPTPTPHRRASGGSAIAATTASTGGEEDDEYVEKLASATKRKTPATLRVRVSRKVRARIEHILIYIVSCCSEYQSCEKGIVGAIAAKATRLAYGRTDDGRHGRTATTK
jgi:hypothetical protein